jgi:hypothetical protein
LGFISLVGTFPVRATVMISFSIGEASHMRIVLKANAGLWGLLFEDR